MSGASGFEIGLLLWAGIFVLFVLSGFLTGEWVAKYREVRDSHRNRRAHSRGPDLPSAQIPHAP